MNRYGVVLGAGMGTRMKSEIPKVLHPVMGRAMIEHAVKALEETNVEKIVVVTGHKKEMVEACLGNRAVYANQHEQLGTAHAVMMAESLLSNLEGTTVVTYGDGPLLTEKTLEKLFASHEASGAKLTMLTAKTDDPTGYGRIVRDAKGDILRIVEQKDASEEELRITEVNPGIACYDNKVLFEALTKVSNDNAQGEYYLTDLVEIIKEIGHGVTTLIADDFEETLGVNDRVQLAEAGRIMRNRINKMHMENGVTLVDPASTYIESDVQIEPDVVIEGNVHLKGKTTIGSGSFIGNGTNLEDATIGTDVTVLSSFVVNSQIGDNSTVGPFAYVREHANVGNNARIGNFVEIKKSVTGEGLKAAHLAYIGDAQLGKNVNMSCGAITANYDGKKKHQTIIGDDVMVGSNVNLVAPVEVGDGAYIAAGSTVTKNVPADALSIGRARQENKEGLAKRF